MSITLNPYLNFRGQAREALEFYASVLGGEPTVTTFAEGGMAEHVGAGEQDLVMHGQLITPLGLTLMCADAPEHIPGAGDREGYSVSLSGTDSDTLAGYWDGLTVGGTITVPFEVAPWGDRFGMFKDRFGVDWMINSLASA
ncbi:hypothetical protein AS850_16010 [Frondihabitans sp. 762G35]|uniref:VOC family protein n=1 Tax=Frondihabitans sp. 762G35 TaxID=1446794 RepID=UPI000D211A27|nr:VOC family protein [Frondihabitans sp. 762G35]ARC58594.1 hypothetical protein AS850_16010 [Frondihabitans sp. 762G35]